MQQHARKPEQTSHPIVGKSKASKQAPPEIIIRNFQVLPANHTFGEGFFFSFNEEKIKEWLLACGDDLKVRYGGDMLIMSFMKNYTKRWNVEAVPNFICFILSIIYIAEGIRVFMWISYGQPQGTSLFF